MAFEHYVMYGGMPHIYNLETDESKNQYLKNLFKDTYIKDMIERKKIQNDQEVLEILLNFVSSAIGSLTNPAKLAKRFQLDSFIRNFAYMVMIQRMVNVVGEQKIYY